MKEDTSEERMSCQRLASSHYPIREQQCQRPTSSSYPGREAGMSAVPEILRGQGDVNKEQSLDSQSHTHTHTERGRFKQESVPGLFSETLERRSSRRGMPIVNTAARRQGEEDLLSLPTPPSVLTTN